MHCLVTAGNTREMIDRVRDWGNVFTGNTGRAIAEALAARGPVDLLTSNAQHARELAGGHARGISVELFRSHADLRALLARKLSGTRYDAVFMTAAVADYLPAGAYAIERRTRLPDGSEQWIVRDVSAGKVSSGYETIVFAGRRSEKLIDLFRSEWGYRGLLVKFKLEVGISEAELIEVAQASRRASRADFIVANTLDMVLGENAGAWLLGDSLQERVPRSQLAQRLAALC